MPGPGYSREPEVTPRADRQHMGGCSTCRDGETQGSQGPEVVPRGVSPQY